MFRIYCATGVVGAISGYDHLAVIKKWSLPMTIFTTGIIQELFPKQDV
jgi:hypothetical protein